MPTPLDLVKDVSKLLEEDNICYVDKQARKIHSFALSEIKTQEVQDQIAALEKKSINFIKVAPMPTQKLIFVMEDFLLVITDQDIAKELRSGLKRKNPTRNFVQVLENRPDINQHWRMYKAEQMQEYVGQVFIDDYNY